MTTFLLWNVHGRKLDGAIVRLVQQHDVDVVLIVEHPKPDTTLYRQLNSIGQFHRLSSGNRFGVFVKFNANLVAPIASPAPGDRVRYWNTSLSARNKLLLVLIHGLDTINNSEPYRSLFFERLANDIRYVESKVGHKNTVVVGDFNANPFDPMVEDISGLHAIKVTDVGGKKTRTVQKQAYEFFCNPMWSCYRGWEKTPRATYYYNRADVHEMFWHMLDQVVLRPQALHMFSERNLRVLTEAGNVSLLTARGLPDAKNASDHLPVLFKLNLNVRERK